MIPTMSDSAKRDESDPVRAPLYADMAVRQQNEYDRLRTQHEFHKAAVKGQLIRVPLSQDGPVRVLDSATGDGFWMVDVAKQYPKATSYNIQLVDANLLGYDGDDALHATRFHGRQYESRSRAQSGRMSQGSWCAWH